MKNNGKESQAMLAVLIDADNAQPSVTEALMGEIAKFGIANVKRIYGDWTTPNLSGWKSIVLDYSIQPIQQFRYTIGKNSTDSAMIIDAMDLLYTGRFNGFCLVSSDSDFTRLAARIREEGIPVYGFGERKTPKAFVSACDKFVYTEVLWAEEEKTAPQQEDAAKTLKGDAKLVNLLRRAVDAASDDSGWASLSGVGSNIAKQFPDFDSRNYGYTKLGELVEATGLFDMQRRGSNIPQSKILYIRDRRKKVQNNNKQREPVTTAEWEQFIQRYHEGDTFRGTIESIVWMGLFITVTDSGVTGLLHKSNLPENFTTCFTVGQEIPVTIKTIHTERHQIELAQA